MRAKSAPDENHCHGIGASRKNRSPAGVNRCTSARRRWRNGRTRRSSIHANRYGLKVTELEALRGYAAQIAQSALAVRSDAGGAEGGGVLLDDGRREPLLGVALDEL